MGYYYEGHLTFTLRKDTPDDVVMLLSHLIYDKHVWGDELAPLPDHQFFKQKRWENIFMHVSGHDEAPRFIRNRKGYFELELHCDINYGLDEILEFVKFITPYVAGRKKKQYVGWWRGEDNRWRNYIHIDKNG